MLPQRLGKMLLANALEVIVMKPLVAAWR